MKYTYTIQGMTCNGCRNHVQETLSKLEGVTRATVDLEKAEAVLETKKKIEKNDLQRVLSAKYKVLNKKEHVDGNASTKITKEKSKLKELKPLLLILFYIAVASILLHKKDGNIPEMMLDFMGLFYIVFSFFKLLDLKGFSNSFSMYDPLAKVFRPYAWVYPFIETVLGLMFLMRFEITSALIATLIVLGITTVGVTKTLLGKKNIQCACLGTALKLPMTEATIIENAIMIIMALLMLINY